MTYFQTDEIIIDSNDSNLVSDHYNKGFVLTRINKGHMIRTRSLRIDINKFKLNTENRRILKKNEDLNLVFKDLPLEEYDWKIHSLGKDFYSKKFGDGTMSATKIKEMFNDQTKSNMNSVLIFNYQNNVEEKVGYCLVYHNNEMLHYAYPFYDLKIPKDQNLGIAMMTKSIELTKNKNLKYIYLGSIVDKTAKYKLQFEGLEWFDTDSKKWSSDIVTLKSILDS